MRFAKLTGTEIDNAFEQEGVFFFGAAPLQLIERGLCPADIAALELGLGKFTQSSESAAGIHRFLIFLLRFFPFTAQRKHVTLSQVHKRCITGIGR